MMFKTRYFAQSLVCSTLCAGMLVAQNTAPTGDDPFASPEAAVTAPNPFDTPAVSPFGSPLPPPAEALPAGAAADPFAEPATAPADPFAAPAAGANLTAPNPFESAAPAPATTSEFSAAPENDPFGNAGVEDPFAAPAATDLGASANPFDSSTPAAEANPFNSAANPATVAAPTAPAVEDPFAAGSAATTTDPFGSGTATASNPFDTAPVAEAPVTDPFAPADATASDPFSNPGAVTSTAAPTSPFAAPTQPVVAPDANPFASIAGGSGVGSPFSSQPVSPFGGPAATETTTDPFSSATAQPSSPFGGPAAAETTTDPFGAAAPASPFGGETASTTAPVGQPASPFGGPAAAPTAPSSPFATGSSSPSPFFSAGSSTAAVASGEANPNGISELYAFRFEQLTRWDGSKFVNRKRLTWDEAKEFDRLAKERYVNFITNPQTPGGLPGYDGTTPPDIWAEWCHYNDQLELWSRYVDDVVLAGTRVDEPDTYSEFQWPGSAAPATEGGGTDPGAGRVPLENYATQTSLDDQTSDLIFGSSSPGGGNNAPSSLDPDVITRQVVAVYNQRLEDLRSLEADQEEFYSNFLDRLAERKTMRLAYADWRNDQEMQIEEAIRDWDRRYNGSVANIGGVRYELYRPGQVPEGGGQRDAVVVVTEFDLTPYDVLNPEDGTLKE